MGYWETESDCVICLLQSPHITSSSSSSEGDEEEADGEAGRGMRGQQEGVSSGKNSSPPPSYNHQQVFNHFKQPLLIFFKKLLGNTVCGSL